MQELFSIIPNLPGVRVLDIGGEPKLFKQLESFCRTKEHELHTIIFDNTPLQSDYANKQSPYWLSLHAYRRMAHEQTVGYPHRYQHDYFVYRF